jgi:gliding motility-associated-like protein
MIRSVLFLVIITSALATYAQSKNENYYRVLAISKVDSNLWSASNRVRAVTPIQMKIPTAFSPNEDGLNDTFGVLAKGLEYFELTVYNRWGEVVFYADKIGARWDGTYKGKPAPAGAYGYQVIAKDADNRSMKRKGTVILVN